MGELDARFDHGITQIVQLNREYACDTLLTSIIDVTMQMASLSQALHARWSKESSP
jgi:hypothetical protein